MQAIPQAQDEEMEELGGMDIAGGEDEPNPGGDLKNKWFAMKLVSPFQKKFV